MMRRDFLSAQPAHLFRAKMAEFRAPLLHSFLVNDPALVRAALADPAGFPKSGRVRGGLAPLLGRSVFVTNGPEWQRQRRLIDPAFAGGRLRDTFPAMQAACDAAVARITDGEADVEPILSHLAADIIFRTLFSVPIDQADAAGVYAAFRRYQQVQPVVNPAALIPGLPVVVPRRARRAARDIRTMVAALVTARQSQIAAGSAPDDLATKIMTATDPETGRGFTPDEMVDQVVIFFLAGHETSAAAMGWALYLLARAPAWQDRVAAEGRAFDGSFSGLSGLRATRDVVRETLRLYPPVPMMVREAARPGIWRKRTVPKGAQIVVSPWILGRHEMMWPRPDAFDPARWSDQGCPALREAFIPFSQGPRVCTGAGFAMAELVLCLARLCADWRVTPCGPDPRPVAHLTLRSANGLWLRFERRA